MKCKKCGKKFADQLFTGDFTLIDRLKAKVTGKVKIECRCGEKYIITIP